MRRQDFERGSQAVQAVIVIPAVMLVATLLGVGGKIALTEQAISSAAADAARTASLSRSAGEARSAARDTAADTLAQQDLDCASLAVNVNAAAFTTAPGQEATVTTDINCTLDLSTFMLPGLPGTMTFDASAASPLDTYRER